MGYDDYRPNAIDHIPGTDKRFRENWRKWAIYLTTRDRDLYYALNPPPK